MDNVLMGQNFAPNFQAEAEPLRSPAQPVDQVSDNPGLLQDKKEDPQPEGNNNNLLMLLAVGFVGFLLFKKRK